MLEPWALCRMTTFTVTLMDVAQVCFMDFGDEMVACFLQVE